MWTDDSPALLICNRLMSKGSTFDRHRMRTAQSKEGLKGPNNNAIKIDVWREDGDMDPVFPM